MLTEEAAAEDDGVREYEADAHVHPLEDVLVCLRRAQTPEAVVADPLPAASGSPSVLLSLASSGGAMNQSGLVSCIGDVMATVLRRYAEP
ncbi:hypothetical protein V5799_030235 [Amblyomma americanum]|uniref:Uncharacterized protein n=1 Tax=Amblyomma americanum TaxID=6943 RepID=A0AAQ4EPH3_AMBAM